MIRLRYGNTNTFYIPGSRGGLLIDTDYAGTLPGFFRAIKSAGLKTEDITWLLITHYHPDHMGIAGDLQKLGVRLLIVDVQMESLHFADPIFAREKHLPFVPVNEKAGKVISCAESRDFLRGLGIAGEIVHTPSHSPDSVSLLLDDGNCFVGDLEPREYLEAYQDNPALEKDWKLVINRIPKRIWYAHQNERGY